MASIRPVNSFYAPEWYGTARQAAHHSCDFPYCKCKATWEGYVRAIGVAVMRTYLCLPHVLFLKSTEESLGTHIIISLEEAEEAWACTRPNK